MKVIKKSAKAPKLTGQLVAIGGRGTAIAQITELTPPLVIGRQPILVKTRGDDLSEQLWARSCSWVQSSRDVDKDGKAYFTLLPVQQAVAKKLVKILKGVKFRRLSDKKVFRGDLLMPLSWKEGQKQPRCVAVVNAKGYKEGRIESTPVKEQDGSEARNRHLVAKILWAK